MLNPSIRYAIAIISSLLLVATLASNLWAAKPIISGEQFPEILLPAPIDPAQRSYLGLVNDQPFTLQQIEGRIALVEILNVHCPHCIKQTKPYNDLHEMIEADPETRGKIKMVGIAVANDDEAIDDFIVIFGVHYPVISDHNFKLHNALRAGQTPFSLYLLRDQPGKSFVVTDTHLGNDFKMDELFDYLKDLLTMKTSDFSAPQQESDLTESALLPPQSEQEVSALVKKTFTAQGQDIDNFHRLDLSSGRWVYTATVTQNGQRQPLFAEVSNRSAICDVCHSVHFFYLFDQTGLILDFVPLQLTKIHNDDWDKAEVDHFTRHIIGKKLDSDWDFDPKVDAVTGATMTSVIIFDDLGKGHALLEELQKDNYLQP
jgi:hypothetical protein